MMISPESYLEEMKALDYEELIKERDRLIHEIRHFEKHKDDVSVEPLQHPFPNVVYQVSLEYLSKLCEYMAERYNAEFIQDDTDE